MERVAVVSGSNKGIGLEIVRQLARSGVHAVLTSRSEAAGQAARAALEREGLRAGYHPLDVTDEQSVRALARWIEAEHGGLDILINNAGVTFDGFDAEVARATLETNLFGALRLTDALLPLLRPGARIVMVSSSLGDRGALAPSLRARFDEAILTRDELLALMRQFIADVAAGRHASEGWPSSAYRVSKIGMTTLTAILGRQLAADGRGILCNAACPGWVRTDMGGPNATRSVEEGADTPVWLAQLPPGGPQGGFFRDRQPATW